MLELFNQTIKRCTCRFSLFPVFEPVTAELGKTFVKGRSATGIRSLTTFRTVSSPWNARSSQQSALLYLSKENEWWDHDISSKFFSSSKFTLAVSDKPFFSMEYQETTPQRPIKLYWLHSASGRTRSKPREWGAYLGATSHNCSELPCSAQDNPQIWGYHGLNGQGQSVPGCLSTFLRQLFCVFRMESRSLECYQFECITSQPCEEVCIRPYPSHSELQNTLAIACHPKERKGETAIEPSNNLGIEDGQTDLDLERVALSLFSWRVPNCFFPWGVFFVNLLSCSWK